MAKRKGKVVRPLTAAEGVALVSVVLGGIALWRLMSWWVLALVLVPVILVLAVRQSAWLHRHRRGLAPLGVGLLVAGVAAGARWVDSPWTWAVLGASVSMLAWVNAVADIGEDRKWFHVGALALGTGWVTAAQLVPVDRYPDLGAVWLLLLVVGYGFHLTDRRVIAEVKVEEKVRSWPEIVKGTELAGTLRPEYADKPEGGWRMRISWAPGQKMLKSVKSMGPLFESLTDAPVGSVSVESNGRPNEVTVECSPVGALGALEWDGVPAVSIMQSMAQSRYGDGSYETYARWEKGVGGKHKLLAGATRSGKSVAMSHDALIYGAAEDVVLWLIDLKGGASLRPLAPLSDWFETTTDGAVAMLEAGARLCDARAHLMAEKGWDPWRPSREYPVIIIKIDETAKLLGMQAPARSQQRALSAAITIGQQGAGLGILIDPATQYATLEALGSSQFREQLMLTECYRLRSEGSAAHFLPNAPTGVEPAHIPASSKGAHYADIEGEFRPLIAQKFNVTDEQKRAIVGEYWDTTPDIEEENWSVLGPEWANRQRWAFVDGKVVRADATTVEMERDMTSEDEELVPATVAPASGLVSQPSQAYAPSWADMDDEGAPTFRELEAARLATLSPEERAAEKAAHVAELARTRVTDPSKAPELVLELMQRVAPDPVSPGDAQRVTGLSESTVHRLLRKWEDEGKVHHEGWGKYSLVASEVPS